MMDASRSEAEQDDKSQPEQVIGGGNVSAGRMAPDILEAPVASFANLGVGLGLLGKIVADKAQPRDAQ